MLADRHIAGLQSQMPNKGMSNARQSSVVELDERGVATVT